MSGLVLWNAGVAKKLATALCNESGISVSEVSTPGFVPCANWDTGSIALGPYNLLNSKQYIWHMYHEIGHLFKENEWHWTAFKKVCRLVEAGKIHPVAKHICNIIIDHLADKSKFGEYPGRDRALAEGLYEFMLSYDIDKVCKSSPLIGTMFIVDSMIRGEWQGDIPIAIPKYIEDFFASIMAFNYEDRLALCSKERDVILLVQDLLSLAEEWEPPEKEEEEGEGDGKGEGEEGEGEAPTETMTGETDPLGSPEDIEEVEKEMGDMKRLPDVVPPEAKGYTAEGYSPLKEYSYVKSKGTPYHTYYEEEIKDILGEHSLSKKIRKYLVVLAANQWRGGQRRGRIHGKNVHRIALGHDQPRAFRVKDSPKLNTSTAFSLLLDMSGSMDGHRYCSGAACFTSAAEVLQDLRIPVEILGFTDHYDVTTHLIKEFHESLVPRDELIRRFSSKTIHMANNADGESLMVAHERLMKRPEKNRILIVGSDGSPAGGGSGNNAAYLEECAKAIEKDSPVKLLAIGLQTDCVKEYYEHWRVVNKMADLEPVLLELLKDSLMK